MDALAAEAYRIRHALHQLWREEEPPVVMEHGSTGLLGKWADGTITYNEVRELRKTCPWSCLEVERPRCPHIVGSRSVEDQFRCMLPADHRRLGIHEIGDDHGVPEPDTNVWEA